MVVLLYVSSGEELIQKLSLSTRNGLIQAILSVQPFSPLNTTLDYCVCPVIVVCARYALARAEHSSALVLYSFKSSRV